MTVYANRFPVTILTGQTASTPFTVPDSTDIIAFQTGFVTLTGTISLQWSLDGSNWVTIVSGVTGFSTGSTNSQANVYIKQPGILFRLLSSSAEAADRQMTILTYGES